MHLESVGDVRLLHLDDDDNRFNPGWVGQFLSLLDEAESGSGASALVTAGTGKFFSNGLDLEWMTAHPDEAGASVALVQELFARVLESPIPTVAAIQGHAFAAGAMLVMAHDVRVMRVDRGYFCLPEVDIKIPFTPGMTALLLSKLAPQTAHRAMAFGPRYGGDDALAAGIVDEVASEDALVPRAIELAASLAGKDRTTLGAIKAGLYAPALAALRDPAAGSALVEFPPGE